MLILGYGIHDDPHRSFQTDVHTSVMAPCLLFEPLSFPALNQRIRRSARVASHRAATAVLRLRRRREEHRRREQPGRLPKVPRLRHLRGSQQLQRGAKRGE